MCWCSCQGPTCCREEIKGLGRIWRVRTHTPEKHNSSHIHHLTKGTVDFFTERRTELLAQAGFVPPNTRYEFLHSFQSIPLITSSLGVCFLILTGCTSEQTPASTGCHKTQSSDVIEMIKQIACLVTDYTWNKKKFSIPLYFGFAAGSSVRCIFCIKGSGNDLKNLILSDSKI